MRPDVVVTMGVKAGCHGAWSLTSIVEEEEQEDEEEHSVLLFGMAKKTRVIYFLKDRTNGTTTPTPLSSKKCGSDSFIVNETTILSGNLLNGKVLVQCCPTKLRILKATKNPKLPTQLCQDGVWSNPKTLGGKLIFIIYFFGYSFYQ
jgi:hypothetical protein